MFISMDQIFGHVKSDLNVRHKGHKGYRAIVPATAQLSRFILCFFFGSSVNIGRWTYVRYCRSAMTEKLFSTGPGTFRRAERKEATDGFDRTSCDSLFHSEMVLYSLTNLW